MRHEELAIPGFTAAALAALSIFCGSAMAQTLMVDLTVDWVEPTKYVSGAPLQPVDIVAYDVQCQGVPVPGDPFSVTSVAPPAQLQVPYSLGQAECRVRTVGTNDIVSDWTPFAQSAPFPADQPMPPGNPSVTSTRITIGVQEP